MSLARQYSIDDLLAVMARLRDPQNGCPWDLQQTFQTIVPSTLEECYELADAIEHEDYAHVREELGDVLFQVIFYSQLGAELDLFRFGDVVHGLVDKLLRRHPHVFADGTIDGAATASVIDEAEVKQRWEAIKAEERAQKTRHGVLDDVPMAMPAIVRAQKLQKRAANVGFDWPSAAPVFNKLREEIAEIEQALAQGDADGVEDEVGDLLFAVTNLARHLQVDAETALRRSNRKFERRFHFIEQQLAAAGKSPAQSSLLEMDSLWDAAKARGL
jgi:nucleoside triphosphate diphosphatase